MNRLTRIRWIVGFGMVALIAIIAWRGTPLLTSYWYEQAEHDLANGKWADARQRLRWAAYLGDQSSMARLAAECITGKTGPRDREEAERWLLRCANASNPQCMETLGLLYWSGFGHSPDFERAKFWLERAVSAGHPGASQYLPGVVRKQKRTDGLM
jgi:TPR repeat protein